MRTLTQVPCIVPYKGSWRFLKIYFRKTSAWYHIYVTLLHNRSILLLRHPRQCLLHPTPLCLLFNGLKGEWQVHILQRLGSQRHRLVFCLRAWVEILVLDPHLCTRIWVSPIIGLLKKPLSIFQSGLKGNSRRTLGNTLTLSGTQRRAHGAALQTLFAAVRLRYDTEWGQITGPSISGTFWA